MKTSFWDKVLMFLYVLIALAFAVCMALRSFGVDLLGGMFAGLEHTAGHFLSVLIGLGLTAIVVLLSAYMVMMIFGRNKKRVPASFITVNSEDGAQVHMSLTALSQMARQAIGRVPDVKDMKICVQSEGEAVSLSVELILKASAHVPTVTKNMQKAIRTSIESNCGVAVRDVEIVVSSLAGTDVKPEWKKPRWKLGRKEKDASVEAVAAQEAAEPVVEVPVSAGADVDDASEQPETREEDWTGSFAPLDEAPQADAPEEYAPKADEAYAENVLVFDDDEDEDEDEDEAEEALFTPSDGETKTDEDAKAKN